MFKKALIEALHNFFSSPKGEELIGTIILKAVSQSMTRTIQTEDGKTEPGKKVIKDERVNVLDFLARYLPSVEASIRGVQVDAGQARNRSTQALNEIGDIKQIFADEIERRNTIDSEILSKALILSKSHALQKMNVEKLKQIGTASLKLCSVNKNKAKDKSCKVLEK